MAGDATPTGAEHGVAGDVTPTGAQHGVTGDITPTGAHLFFLISGGSSPCNCLALSGRVFPLY